MFFGPLQTLRLSTLWTTDAGLKDLQEALPGVMIIGP